LGIVGGADTGKKPKSGS